MAETVSILKIKTALMFERGDRPGGRHFLASSRASQANCMMALGRLRRPLFWRSRQRSNRIYDQIFRYLRPPLIGLAVPNDPIRAVQRDHVRARRRSD
jgi:hypothetical protein